jgi:hypothetical protein
METVGLIESCKGGSRHTALSHARQDTHREFRSLWIPVPSKLSQQGIKGLLMAAQMAPVKAALNITARLEAARLEMHSLINESRKVCAEVLPDPCASFWLETRMAAPMTLS